MTPCWHAPKTSRSSVIAASRSAPAKPISPSAGQNLAAAEAALSRLAAELEWSGDIDQLIARIPAKAKVAVLRGLLNRRGRAIRRG